jgi:hypothetical protein
MFQFINFFKYKNQSNKAELIHEINENFFDVKTIQLNGKKFISIKDLSMLLENDISQLEARGTNEFHDGASKYAFILRENLNKL